MRAEPRNGIGLRLREARASLGITQAELADRIGMRPLTVNRIETGGYMPARRTSAAIADALGITESWLMNGVGWCSEYDNSANQPGAELYVFEVEGLCVKVGISDCAAERIAHHTSDLARMGHKIGSRWISERHVEAYSNERAVICGIPTLFGREWLRATYEQVVSKAQSLPMTKIGASS